MALLEQEIEQYVAALVLEWAIPEEEHPHLLPPQSSQKHVQEEPPSHEEQEWDFLVRSPARKSFIPTAR